MVAITGPRNHDPDEEVRAVRVQHADQSTVLELRQGQTYTMGRSDRAEVVFGEARVSRLHGMLWWDAGCWYYRDLGSANGSFSFEASDYDRHLAEGTDLPARRIRKGQARGLRVGEGVLLGTRHARLEMLGTIPVDARPTGDLPRAAIISPVPKPSRTVFDPELDAIDSIEATIAPRSASFFVLPLVGEDQR